MQSEGDLIRFEVVESGEVQLNVARAGPEDGPLVILLHGFPEYWYGWRHQIDPLVTAGYRLWIPDQRGYHRSDRPQEIAAYSLDRLADDVVAIIEAAGESSARIIGHDWGGAVAWWLANRNPERVRQLVILNAPHHSPMRRLLRGNPRQFLRAIHISLFQIPRLPEWLLSAGDFWGMHWLMRASSRPDTFTREDLAAYRSAWEQPGALTGMLNYYRALTRNPPAGLPSPRITVATLLIWGMKDQVFLHQVVQESIGLCDDGRLELIPEGTHWVQHDAPAKVNRLIVDFLAEGD